MVTNTGSISFSAGVQATLEIHAHVPKGIDERTVSVVNTKAGAQKFDECGFEEE